MIHNTYRDKARGLHEVGVAVDIVLHYLLQGVRLFVILALMEMVTILLLLLMMMMNTMIAVIHCTYRDEARGIHEVVVVVDVVLHCLLQSVRLLVNLALMEMVTMLLLSLLIIMLMMITMIIMIYLQRQYQGYPQGQCCG